MVGTLSRVTALLLSVAILLTGHGLQLTLLPVHGQGLAWTAYAIGSTGSVYFLGFVLGCVVIPSIVARVGHVRTFMVMSAIATIALLGAGLWATLPSWLVLRAATGFALSGLYMVIESWLNEVSPREYRGRVLAVYSMICLLGMALGQLLMALGTPDNLDLFVVGGILLCLAIVPVGLTRVATPLPLPSMRFRARVLLEASRVSVVCALFAGLVTGSFWSLGPVVGQAFGLEPGGIGALMGFGIVGGALAQVPVGRLSDLTDRRLVVGGIMTAGAAVAAMGGLLAADNVLLLYIAIFLIGATTMPIYALCIAHASDNTHLPLVEVTSGVLIVHSVGSILGPLIVAVLIDLNGAPSFFWYVLGCLTVASIWTFHRCFVVERAHDHTRTAILPRTTQVIAALSDEAPPRTTVRGPQSPNTRATRPRP
jgi:MFS family permease